MYSKIKVLKRIDELVSKKSTGPPAELARKLGLSERSIYEYIRLMKELDAPILYSRARKSYFYKNEGQFTISFVPN
jgi:hypothetical protein